MRRISASGGIGVVRSRCATCASACTPASVRPEPYSSNSRAPVAARDRALDLSLDRSRVLLHLPAAVARAGVLDRQLEAGTDHGYRVRCIRSSTCPSCRSSSP